MDRGASCRYADITAVADRQPMIKDVHHVGIAVRDLDAALGLFRDTLELPCVKEGEMVPRGVRVAVLAAGQSYLEIIQPVSDSSPFAKHIGARTLMRMSQSYVTWACSLRTASRATASPVA
jgi:hypothetical protein